MANMSTNVQRSWDKLLAGDNSPSLACVSQFREWMLSDLLKVSRLLQFPMEEAHDNRVRHYLLTAPIDLFAVQRIAWEEFAVSLTHRPPTFNPEALWQWAELSLWKLLVPVIPDEACDNDQFDLELWWSTSSQRAVYICGLGEHFAFRRRTAGRYGKAKKWQPLETWGAETEELMPALREVVSRLFPELELLV